ncbi:MAG: family 10 glycosylhydrolase [Planctomycetota bacterium]
MKSSPRPRFVGLRPLSTPALLGICCAMAGTAHAQPAEVRGTWMTTTGPDIIASGLFTDSFSADLANIGINTLYTETWKNGYTNWDSQIMQDLIGVDRNPTIGASRDLVDEATASSHRHGLIQIGWAEYGFSSQFQGSGGGIADNPLTAYARSQGWLLEDQLGNNTNASNGFVWMNPAVPEVRELLIDLTLEKIREHDLDGIQFDDRLSWPREFGWDATTAALYQADTGNSLPGSTNNSAFRNWRQDKVTQFAQELSEAVRSYRPDIQLSVSPSITTFSDVNFNAEWPEWQDQGLFDEYVIQAYRDDIAAFNAILPGQTAEFAGGDGGELVLGLRLNGSGPDTPIADLEQMIVNSALALGGTTAGHSTFYSLGVLQNAASLTPFYGGDAFNPFFDEDRRDTVLPGVQDLGDPSVFNFAVFDAEQYRLIGFDGLRWQELGSFELDAGLTSFDRPGFSQLELLPDLRPIEGDATFDRTVDLLDFDVISTNFGTVGGLVDGDLNWDGVVTLLDFDILAQNFGKSFAPATTGTVPEPASAVALGLLGLAVLRRRRG